MGQTLLFGVIVGAMAFLSVSDFVVYTIWSRTKQSQLGQECLCWVGRWGEVWRWRRSLWTWEEECRILLHEVSLQATSSDMWQWHLDPTRGYSVHDVYDMLASKQHASVHSNMELIWHNQVPLKVSIFAWRLLRDILPTKSNLATRGVISTEA